MLKELINPDDKKVEEDGYYNILVADKIKDFWLLMTFIVIGFMVIIGLLAFDYYEDKKDSQSSDLIESKEEEKKKDKKIDTRLIIKIFFSWEFSRVVIMQIGCTIFLYMISVTMRPFGESVKKLDIELLKKLS